MSYQTNILLKFVALFVTLVGAGSAKSEPPKDKYYQQLDGIRAKYRITIAQNIRDAQRADLFLLRFDGLKKMPSYGAGGYGSKIKDVPQFEVVRYGKSTDIIKKIKLDAAESLDLLNSLADQVQKPEHGGGALCHFPVHGIRVYSDEDGEDLVYSGTFCWKCSNFGFAYPEGSAWLDTSETLKKKMNRLLPIPPAELERFEKKFPSRRLVSEAQEQTSPSDSHLKIPAEK